MIEFNKEQRFIVTGASSGIGESVALLLNELGASVIAIGRNQERMESMKKKCTHAENMFLEYKDLSENMEALPNYIKSLKEKYGKFQGLAYCAGIGTLQVLRAVDLEQLQKNYAINCFAPIFMAKSFADKRIHNGHGSSCVFISSVAAHKCDKGQIIYAGTKAALTASIRSIAREQASTGVRFNCVSPAEIKTPMVLQASTEFLDERNSLYPLGMGEVEDVAHFIIFLLSNKSKWITSQDYIIDCGGIL